MRTEKFRGKIAKTFQGNVESLNNLIYEIQQKSRENFNNFQLSFMRIMKVLNVEKSGKFGVSIFKNKYKKFLQKLKIFYEIDGKF